jgi:hypothetical protein
MHSPSRAGRPMLLERSDGVVDLLAGEQDFGLGLDVPDELSPPQDVWRHYRLEFCTANEHNHGMETSSVEIEEDLNCLQVLVVLT